MIKLYMEIRNFHLLFTSREKKHGWRKKRKCGWRGKNATRKVYNNISRECSKVYKIDTDERYSNRHTTQKSKISRGYTLSAETPGTKPCFHPPVCTHQPHQVGRRTGKTQNTLSSFLSNPQSKGSAKNSEGTQIRTHILCNLFCLLSARTSDDTSACNRP